MLQGVGLAGGAWRPQVEAFASDFQVVCVDNPGVGSIHTSSATRGA